MCGIVGVYDPSGRSLPEQKLLENMTRTLRHRGPDEFGYYLDDQVRLGHSRLSIIDLVGGAQPIKNEDGSVIVVFNGEIYNYRALRKELEQVGHQFNTHSDTEVLVHAYEEFGDRFPERLDGMFTIALWDLRRQRLLLARDRFGEKPLYFCRRNEALFFASEPRALLAHPAVSRELDHAALSLYLLFDYIPTPYSIYREIEKLPSGCLMIAERGHLDIIRYWDLPPSSGETRVDFESFDSLLRSTIADRLTADVPVGIALSGGIDSATILYGAVAERGPENVTAYSIGFGDADYDETARARQTARHFGVRHHCRVLDSNALQSVLPDILGHLDEPFADASLIPTYLLCRTMREHVTVALGGDGGDELMAGYPIFKAQAVARWLEFMPATFWKWCAGMAPAPPADAHPYDFLFVLKRFLSGMTHDFGGRQLHWVGGTSMETVQSLIRHPVPAAESLLDDIVAKEMRGLAGMEVTNKTSSFCMRTYLADDILVKVDRAAMAVSLEFRSPFLGGRLSEYLWNLSPDLKMAHGRTKVFLRRFMNNRLPEAVLSAAKRGFGFPISRWFRGGMKDDLRATLLTDGMLDLFHKDHLLRIFELHQRGHDQRQLLWRLYVLGKFMEKNAVH